MDHLSDADLRSLLNAIALRQGKTKELAERYSTTVTELKEFVELNREELTRIREEYEAREEDSGEPTPSELDNLWITKKTERLERYQEVVDKLYGEFIDGSRDAAVMRELRFYMQAVANELGQLLHRGSGEAGSDSLSVDVMGVDINVLR